MISAPRTRRLAATVTDPLKSCGRCAGYKTCSPNVQQVTWCTVALRSLDVSVNIMLNRLKIFTALGALAGVVNAQFPPTPEGIKVLDSKLTDGVRISYKEVRNFQCIGPIKSSYID
jgi:hypothetical protein